jgi:hypothetical protein
VRLGMVLGMVLAEIGLLTTGLEAILVDLAIR